MADDNDTPKEDDPPKPPPMPNPDHATKSELEAHKKEMEQYRRELKEELEELHQADHAEREELRRQLAEATEYINELKKAEAKRDEIKDSKTTLVLPPNDIPPQQPATPPANAQPGKEDKQSFFRRIW